MIHYQLRCSQQHEFDGWFKDSAAFAKQAKRRLVECPVCGDTDVTRALMAPAVATSREAPPPAPPHPPAAVPAKTASGKIPAQLVAMLQRLRAEIEKHCEYVGRDFAEEARRIHRVEVDPRAIYGEATDEEVEELAQDGIQVARIPWVPRAEG
jgi:hypothetical protein